MSKKSNMRRTQRRKRTRAYNAAKVATHQRDVAEQQAAARKAYKEAQSVRRKRVFTSGAKAVLASVAIMLMFIASLVSWSVVKTARQRRDDQTQQDAQSESKMVTSDMVTGMTRPAVNEMSKGLRFAGFARTDGGYDGKAIFGGRVSAEGVDDLMAERQRLEDEWQKAADKRKASSETTTIADQAKSTDESGGTSKSVSDANKTRYQSVTSEDGTIAVGTAQDDSGKSGSSSSLSVPDEQIKKLIESAEASSSQ